MEQTSHGFVYRILALHGLLLAAVLALVFLASSEIYNSTRADAIDEAKIRQELLAYQTCRGIETFYSSIISSLGWIQDRQEIPSQTGTETRVRDVTTNLEIGARPMAAELIAEQLGDRVSAMFVYNQRTGGVVPILPANSTLNGGQLPTEMQEWLKSVDRIKVSRFIKLNGEGVSLVAAPFNTGPIAPRLGRRVATRPAGRIVQGNLQPRLLVAVVPGAEIESNFLPLLTDQNSAATLVDGELQIITSSDRKLDGLNLSDIDNPDAHDMVLAYHDHPHTMTKLFNEPISLYGVNLGPRMVTLAPVHIGQDEWALFFAYPLEDIDSAVNSLFKRSAIWAGFVAAMVTGVLVSTAVQMIHSRMRLERVRHQVITRELKQARRIQEQWLPDKSGIPEGLDVAAINTPASHISGDFYNWFEAPDGRQVFVIGDVTGHGMAAAFLMATTQLLVRNIMARVSDPGAAMEAVNRQLCSQMFHGQFVTMLILAMDFKKNQLEAASAGHPPPLIGANGKLRRLELEAQLVLGVEKQVRYPTQKFPLPPMSNVLLYTDGVLDAHSSTGDHFGTERLLAALNGHCATAQEMINSISAAVRQFCGKLEPEDDLTLLAIQLQNSKVSAVKSSRTLEPLNP